jgi:2-keto-3-deoxy-L-rhamnonate aldolase RhmA
MVESTEGARAIDEIVSVPGLSGIFIGLADLAVSMGHLHNLGHPDVDEAASRIANAALAAGMPFGVFTGTQDAARRWIERGAQLVTVGSDLQFIDAGIAASESLAQRLKAERA